MTNYTGLCIHTRLLYTSAAWTWGVMTDGNGNYGASRILDDDSFNLVPEWDAQATELWANQGSGVGGGYKNDGELKTRILQSLPNTDWEFILYQAADADAYGSNHSRVSADQFDELDLSNLTNGNDYYLMCRLKGTETGSELGSPTERASGPNDSIKFRYDDVNDDLYVQFESGSEFLIADGTITDNADLKAFFEALYPNSACFDFAYNTTTGIIEVRWVSTCDAGTWDFSVSLSEEINIGDEVNVSVMRHWPLTKRKWLQ